MTTIAVDRTMMAGDKQFTYAGAVKMMGKTKIYELPSHSAKNIFGHDKVFIGFCGDASKFGPAIGWLHNPEGKPPKIKGAEVVMLNSKGEIYTGNSLSNWMKVEDKFFAIGSGMPYAVAAMAAGKTPYEAVKISSKFDVNTGMGFNKLVL